MRSVVLVDGWKVGMSYVYMYYELRIVVKFLNENKKMKRICFVM